MKTLQPNALGLSFALLGAIFMLAFSLLALSGIYTELYEATRDWYLFYDLSVAGIIGGMVEVGLWSYISGVVIAWFYNWFAK